MRTHLARRRGSEGRRRLLHYRPAAGVLYEPAPEEGPDTRAFLGVLGRLGGIERADVFAAWLADFIMWYARTDAERELLDRYRQLPEAKQAALLAVAREMWAGVWGKEDG